LEEVLQAQPEHVEVINLLAYCYKKESKIPYYQQKYKSLLKRAHSVIFNGTFDA
jgi:hypothetical protein